MIELPTPSPLLADLLVAELVAAGLPTGIEDKGSTIVLWDLNESDRPATSVVFDAHAATAQARIDEGERIRTNEATIRTRASGALATNTAFLALASPTNAQTLAQVRALTRQNNGLIRLILGRLDSAD